MGDYCERLVGQGPQEIFLDLVRGHSHTPSPLPVAELKIYCIHFTGIPQVRDVSAFHRADIRPCEQSIPR